MKKLPKTAKSTPQKRTQRKIHKTMALTAGRKRPKRVPLINPVKTIGQSIQFVWSRKGIFSQLVVLHVVFTVVFAPNAVAQNDQKLLSGFFYLVFILAHLLVLRIAWAKPKAVLPSVKTILYRAPVQLVPLLLLSILFTLQLIPLAFASQVYVIGVLSEVPIADTMLLKYLFAIVCLLLSLPTFYWISTSFLAFFAVSLEGVTPLNAWRAAVNLGDGMRLKLLLRVLVMFGLYFGFLGAILVPAILLQNPEFILLSPAIAGVVSLPLVLTYGYSVYKELIDARA